MPRIPEKVWDVLTSLKLTIICMAALMVLTVACTLAQVHLGTFGAVDVYMRRWVVWWDVPGSVWSIPVFPGGAAVGAVLAVNLFAAQLRRLELSWKKAGLWIVHAGLILLVVGEFVTGMYQLETNMAIEEGGTANHLEVARQMELAVIDRTNPATDEIYSVPEGLLARASEIAIPGTPITLAVRNFFKNADLQMRRPGDPALPANATGLAQQVTVRELAPASRDEDMNSTTAYVEPKVGGQSKGVYLVSVRLGQPQFFTGPDGHSYELAMRPRRVYLPYTLTLKKFRHDVYPGTDIPKNFSSLVHLSNPSKGEERDVLIYMNQPLRYDGKAFYQASFGKGDTLSILQVVSNPGWLLPYVSCVLVTIGLLVHFAITMRRSMRKQAQAREAQATAATAEV